MVTETQKIPNLKSLKLLIKGSLVIIGLFIVLYCSVAVILLHFGENLESKKNIEISSNNGNDKGNENNEIGKKIVIDKNIMSKNFEYKIFILILVLIGLPILVFIIVFFRFSCLLKFYCIKLSDSLDNEGFLLKMHDINSLINMYRMMIKANNIMKKKNIKRYKSC